MPRSRSRSRSPSLADVAERARVSPSLVSRLLRGDDSVRVREETRRRVLAVAEEVGYVPHLLARHLRMSRAGAIGLIVHEISNPIYAEIIRGAQKAVTRAGSVLLLIDAEVVTDEVALLGVAGGGRVDGLLWQMAGHAGLDHAVHVAARYVPVVLVNSRAEHDLPGVHLDDEGATRMAMGHLFDLGHERIGFVSGAPGSDVSERRRAAYRASLAEAGIRRRAAWEVEGGWDSGSGHRAAAGLLRRDTRPTAVLATNALVATGVVTAAYEAGVRVPDELSVVAIHDLWFAERLMPALTVVRLPLITMGERAADLLVCDEQPTGPVDIAITDPMPQLVERGSTAPAPSTPKRHRHRGPRRTAS
ncbi:LacI family DNA-binding transcriptional regulator [Actinopolymorpha sp. B11F2]|uniref:LacI family DNA-binding transcriptional regulator n=1 Tax=Actinopolymorpha sp. B11F2 TaxID=3160862 RepID=UPI0032E41CCF